MNFKSESGRSMTEMLGTLAIIGVLSIGGIAGYSYGMDKYRCNQTMRDISLRTVDLLTQASQGHSTLSLAEWENEESVYDFSNPTHAEGGVIKFDIGATNKVPKSVCGMIFDGLSNTATQIDINGSVATSKDSCGEDNTMTFYFASGGNASAGTDTGGDTGEQCGSTVCGTCQKCKNETCVTADDYEMACTTNGQTGWCVSGSCKPDTTCNCDEGYYCADKNEYGGSCEHPTPSGNCVEAEPQFRTVDIAGTTYYISKDHMSWWDAVSACKALGNKKLLSVYDLVGDWDGTGPNSSGELTNTALTEALYSEMGGVHIWSSNLYDSCVMYLVYLNLTNGHISTSSRLPDNYAYAVCR